MTTDDTDLHDEVTIRPLDSIVPYGENPKEHPQEQVDKIASSIQRFGWDQPIVVDGDGTIIKGHGRYQAAQKLGLDEVPVIEQPDLSDAEARAARIADNRVAESEWDDDLLAVELELVEESPIDAELTGFDGDEPTSISEDEPDNEPFQPHEIDPEGMSSRESPIDAIITGFAGPPKCCLAVDAGFSFGFQSGESVSCQNVGYKDGHEVVFIDNEWDNYNHETHVRDVKEYRPKYATTRDIVAKDECREKNIEYYSIEQVLEWASELDQYADNVIVIPKYDCIEEIPEKYVLGYSVPTSHGGTTVDIEKFRGRDIHLLGGSWEKQLQFLEEFGNDVVSLDNNYVHKIAPFGQVRLKNGDTKELNHFGFTDLSNPRSSALALSFGSMMSKLQDLHPGHTDTDDDTAC